jgi:hypothetical protein
VPRPSFTSFRRRGEDPGGAAAVPQGSPADLPDARRKRIAIYPSDHFKVTYSIAFDHPLLRHQSRTIRLSSDAFVDEIAPARTFTFLKEVEMLRQQGLALGGSLENAIVISDTGVLNNGLRFDDEFVRHKILDVIGDMALVGYPMIGHLVAHRGGHALHTAFAAQVLEDSEAWVLVEGRMDAGRLYQGRLAWPIRLRPTESGFVPGSSAAIGRCGACTLPACRSRTSPCSGTGSPGDRRGARVVHLIDQVVDFPHHVLEGAFQLAACSDLAIQSFHDGEEVAVEGDFGSGCRLDGSSTHAPKLLIADASSG